ncbi:uracil-DNA glycosylase [Sphaerobacter sp.]|uniref:uracil-DNA glycosylase n=1 Tax=Sphaerobacter sp. TaxID=2099654 RepID=UPI001D747B07|nr:uracil-DNA glycosylase [Sphaerobacter sp.]MBX5445085.1 uracil-DNA glycosylase [Sphaerobacter sp.]
MVDDEQIVARSRRMEQIRREMLAASGFASHCDEKRPVFGEGSLAADLVLIGEAPGGREERLGHPFVGPAGQVLTEALALAGIDRDELWITNVVKCRPTMEGVGGRLRNRTPTPAEVEWFRPWLLRELDVIDPRAIVCLGATAGSAVLQRTLRITRERGIWFDGPNGLPTLVTYHPAYLLRRTQDRDDRFSEFIDDLRTAGERAAVVSSE